MINLHNHAAVHTNLKMTNRADAQLLGVFILGRLSDPCRYTYPCRHINPCRHTYPCRRIDPCRHTYPCRRIDPSTPVSLTHTNSGCDDQQLSTTTIDYS